MHCKNIQLSCAVWLLSWLPISRFQAVNTLHSAHLHKLPCLSVQYVRPHLKVAHGIAVPPQQGAQARQHALDVVLYMPEVFQQVG